MPGDQPAGGVVAGSVGSAGSDVVGAVAVAAGVGASVSGAGSSEGAFVGAGWSEGSVEGASDGDVWLSVGTLSSSWGVSPSEPPPMRPIVGPPPPSVPPVIDETLSPATSSNAVMARTAAANSPAAISEILFHGSSHETLSPTGAGRLVRQGAEVVLRVVEALLSVGEVGVDRLVVALAPGGPPHFGLGDTDLAHRGGLHMSQTLVAAGQALAVERSADRHDHATERGADDGAGRTEGREEKRGRHRRESSAGRLEPVDLELRGGVVGHHHPVCRPVDDPPKSSMRVLPRYACTSPNIDLPPHATGAPDRLSSS